MTCGELYQLFIEYTPEGVYKLLTEYNFDPQTIDYMFRTCTERFI